MRLRFSAVAVGCLVGFSACGNGDDIFEILRRELTARCSKAAFLGELRRGGLRLGGGPQCTFNVSPFDAGVLHAPKRCASARVANG